MPAIQTGRIINGVTHDSSSIVISAANKPYADITEISYSDGLEPGILQGTDIYPRARTRGKYTAEASFTIAKDAYEALKRSLLTMGEGGFGQATFLITVTYRANRNSPVIVDVIEGCRIMKQENSHSAGNSDALVTKVDLSVYRIKWNGLYLAEAAEGTSALIGL